MRTTYWPASRSGTGHWPVPGGPFKTGDCQARCSVYNGGNPLKGVIFSLGWVKFRLWRIKHIMYVAVFNFIVLSQLIWNCRFISHVLHGLMLFRNPLHGITANLALSHMWPESLHGREYLCTEQAFKNWRHIDSGKCCDEGIENCGTKSHVRVPHLWIPQLIIWTKQTVLWPYNSLIHQLSPLHLSPSFPFLSLSAFYPLLQPLLTPIYSWQGDL